MSDVQLLRDYAAEGSEAAFAELVRRHADLVYSAALRQVESPDLASDVAQQLFTDLARKAGTLAVEFPENASLVGWLYRGVRYESLDLRRTELRRRHREQQAMQHLDAIDDSPDWTALGPQLDAAMDELEPADRDALLLRYFQNRDLRAVGTTLGISDDAAQKRVSRAVDKLRAVLAGKGVATSAAGLAAVVSAQAVQAAPAGLAASLTAVSVAAPTVLTASTVQAIAMTTTQKVLLGTVLAAALGTGLYEAREAGQLRSDVAALREAQTPLNARLAELEAERSKLSKLSNLVASLNAENDRLQAQAIDGLKLHQKAVQLADRTQREVSGADPDVQEALRWKANKEKLHRLFAERPSQWIPELALLDDSAWLDMGRGADLSTEDGIRKAMSGLRRRAEAEFVHQISGAVREFAEAHNGSFPESVSQLTSHLQPPADSSWLNRYAVRPAEEFPSARLGGNSVIVPLTAIDEDHDQQWIVGPNGLSFQPFKPDPVASAVNLLHPAVKAYAADHNGREPNSVAEITNMERYLKTPEQKAAYQTLKEAMAKKIAAGEMK